MKDERDRGRMIRKSTRENKTETRRERERQGDRFIFLP